MSDQNPPESPVPPAGPPQGQEPVTSPSGPPSPANPEPPVPAAGSGWSGGPTWGQRPAWGERPTWAEQPASAGRPTWAPPPAEPGPSGWAAPPGAPMPPEDMYVTSGGGLPPVGGNPLGSPQAGGGRRRRALVVVSGAVVVALAAALVMVASRRSHNEASRAAGIVPADAIGFVSISLEPSLLQRKDLFQIARKFPQGQVQRSFGESKDKLLTEVAKSVCLDYATQVKPWLGSEVALAVLPGSSEPAPVVLIRVNDETKARLALDAATRSRCRQDDGGTTPVYRIANGFAVIAPSGTDAAVNAIVAQGAKHDGGLARAPGFTSSRSTSSMAIVWPSGGSTPTPSVRRRRARAVD